MLKTITAAMLLVATLITAISCVRVEEPQPTLTPAPTTTAIQPHQTILLSAGINHDHAAVKESEKAYCQLMEALNYPKDWSQHPDHEQAVAETLDLVYDKYQFSTQEAFINATIRSLLVAYPTTEDLQEFCASYTE